jgi:CRISPR/Cas system-associated protein Cas7 (RAMP superfamily)
MLFEDYYKIKSNKDYIGLDVEELNAVECHFSLNINVYRFNGKKAELERHSVKEYEDVLYLNIFTDKKQNLHHFRLPAFLLSCCWY